MSETLNFKWRKPENIPLILRVADDIIALFEAATSVPDPSHHELFRFADCMLENESKDVVPFTPGVILKNRDVKEYEQMRGSLGMAVTNREQLEAVLMGFFSICKMLTEVGRGDDQLSQTVLENTPTLLRLQIRHLKDVRATLQPL